MLACFRLVEEETTPAAFRETEDEVMEIITDTVTRSRNLIDDVEWSAMDATRTPIDYLDFASPEAGLGGKLGLDATSKMPPETSMTASAST